ncbi:hypothetical protein SLEP1_g53256 [Rubroshorea leprosula]|nr:hypothetical protein SLEP1_g53256 [Rubroshorea leprosula]
MSGIGSQVVPVSVGCYTGVGISMMLNQIMPEMQERMQRMEDTINALQSSVLAALTQFGSCPQANAPTIFPTEPHHDPLGMQEGTNDAAGSSGGPTTQSFPHNEEV